MTRILMFALLAMLNPPVADAFAVNAQQFSAEACHPLATPRVVFATKSFQIMFSALPRSIVALSAPDFGGHVKIRPMKSLFPPTGDLTADQVDLAYAWPDLPWLRTNMVASVDGAAQAPDGLSRGIANAADTELFGMLRGRADAIVVGAATVRAEGYRPVRVKPRYSAARAMAGQRPAAVVAIVSRSLDLDVASELFTQSVERPVILTTERSDQTARRQVTQFADVIVCGDKNVDLALALTELRLRGLTWLHCEGGPSLLAQLAAADLVDEWCVTISPRLAGGSYPNGGSPSRMLAGAELPRAPADLALHRVLVASDTLFLTYGRPPTSLI